MIRDTQLAWHRKLIAQKWTYARTGPGRHRIAQEITRSETNSLRRLNLLSKAVDLQPCVFIPAAESTGDIVQFGEWVLRGACSQFKKWQFEGMPISRLSVNLSPRQFRQSEFVSKVSGILYDSDLDPSCLELEVTESSIIHDPETAVAMLHDLKELGVRVAMDDFGTGYSSLRYLRDLPVDVVKIDRSFIRDIPDDSGDVEIVTAIIAMARGLKKEVVAEGVETDEQLELLTDLGCDKVQGYLIVEATEVVRWMEINAREDSKSTDKQNHHCEARNLNN